MYFVQQFIALICFFLNVKQKNRKLGFEILVNMYFDIKNMLVFFSFSVKQELFLIISSYNFCLKQNDLKI